MSLLDMDASSSPNTNSFEGCKVRGLPIGVPFKSKFYIPKERRILFVDELYTFIIKPVSKSDLIQRSDEASDLVTETLNGKTNDTYDLGCVPMKSKREVNHIISNTEDGQQINIAHESVAISHIKGRNSNEQNTEHIKTQGQQSDITKKRVAISDTKVTISNKQNTEYIESHSQDSDITHKSVGISDTKITISNKQNTEQNTENNEPHGQKSDNTHERAAISEMKEIVSLENINENIEKPSRKRKKLDDCNDGMVIKHVKKIDDVMTEGQEGSRRRSLRIQAVGYRPDYQAIVTELDEVDSGNMIDEGEQGYSEMKQGIKLKELVNINVEIGCCHNVENIQINELENSTQSVQIGNDLDFETLADEAAVLEDQEDDEFLNDFDDLIDDSENDETYSKSKCKKQGEKSKKGKRIKIKLEEHTDKYAKEVFQSYSRKDRGKTAEETSQKLFVCTVCKKFKTEDLAVLENHIEMHINKELNCDQCDFVAPYVGDVYVHKRQEHKRNVAICAECNKEIGNGSEGMKNHLGKAHGAPQWECAHCLKKGISNIRFTVKRLLNVHSRQEHPETFEQCMICERLFYNKHLLRKHVKDGCLGKHPPTSYPCEKCGKSYKTKSMVAKHVERVHSKVRRHQCPNCPFASASRGGLNQHLLTHSGHHPFHCNECSFSCIQAYQLTSHMRTHTGEKPYKCGKCKFAAAWKVQLKEHEKAHNISTAVTCKRCDIVFKDSRSLKSHEKKEHTLSYNISQGGVLSKALLQL